MVEKKSIKLKSADKFSLKIKVRRTELGLNQAELGQKVGVSYQTINTWENSPPKKFSRHKLEKLSSALGISPYLLTGEGPPDVNLKDVDTTDIDAVISSYSKHADELSQEDRALLLKVLLEDREDHRNRIQILENYIEHLRGLLDDNQIKYVPLLHRSGTEG